MARKAARAKAAESSSSPSARNPEETRRKLIDAGMDVFARYGLLGARVDMIAEQAGVNKQLIYYHFGDKDGLYSAVLEAAYRDIRASERELSLAELAPDVAIERLTKFSFDYLVANPAFVALLRDENVHRGTHLRQSPVLRELRSPFIQMIAETLRRGERAGIFRSGIDPVQFYMSLTGLCYFYLTNIHTLSELFDQDLNAPEALARRRAHVVEFVMGFLAGPQTAISIEE
ncbi:MAG: TetR family transcriptional regulator [Bradyrhizobium sp.]